MGFRSLQHIKDRRSTLRGLTSPAVFRLQGLATLLTAYSLRARADLVSCRRRSWDSPFGAFPLSRVSRHSCREGPTCRSPGGIPCRTQGPAGKASGADFWALTPGQVPRCRARPKTHVPTGCSLGFRPFQGSFSDGLEPAPADSSLTCLAFRILVPRTTHTSELRSAVSQARPRGTSYPS
jgi:hypothetical protein